MDAGYKTPAIAKKLLDDGIQPVFPYTAPKRKSKIENPYYKREFIYDEYYDCYLCPENQILEYTTTNREGYREYKSNKEQCKKCPNLKRCTQSKNYQKVITRHLWQKYLEETEEYRYINKEKEEYKRRKETVERQFGSAKEFHGFRYTNMIGLAKMEMKAALTFACINMKKLAILLYKLDHNKDLTLDKLKIFLVNILRMQQTQKLFLGLSTIWQVLKITCFFSGNFLYKFYNIW